MCFQKERDLELAARIGQTLLTKNKELSSRGEYLDEQLTLANEKVCKHRDACHACALFIASEKNSCLFVFVGLVVIWGVWVRGGGVIASEKNSWFLFV